MKQLVQFSDNLDESFDSRVRPEAEGSKQYIQKLKSDHILLDEELSNHIRILWNDQGIRNTFAQRSKFQFMDAAEYFFDNLDRITPSDYHPTYEDVLRCRVRTTGIVESHFKLSGHQFVLIDVGGQRNERKKWIHCFEGVTAVIFVASLSEYDQLLFEDNSTNRVIESLSLFEEICGSRWFSRSPIILFLNKRDLFMKKLENTPLQQYFEDYNGGCDYNQGVKFMENLFLSRVPPKKSPDQIFVHVTCATDKDNVQHVFNDVKEIFITQNLLESGLALM